MSYFRNPARTRAPFGPTPQVWIDPNEKASAGTLRRLAMLRRAVVEDVATIRRELPETEREASAELARVTSCYSTLGKAAEAYKAWLTSFAVCPCGALYSTREAWGALPLVGVQSFEGMATALELRNCPCGSTRAVEVP